MDRLTFWKNFRIGEELNIAGRFIYNGLRCCHEMEHFHHEDEVFEMMYHLSVGLERLLKVAVVLAEHDDSMDQEEFEKSLITHTHLVLLNRAAAKHDLRLSGQHKEFLNLLGTFYKSQRYGRYNIGSTSGAERKAICSFVGKHLKIVIHDEFPFNITPNCPRIRRFIGRVVGKISTVLFDAITRDAGRLNIFTDEIRYDSKAAKIFLCQDFTFEKEALLVKELLLHFMKAEATTGHIGLLKQLEPLEFDIGLDAEHIQALLSDEKKINVIGELDALYSDSKKRKDRWELLDLIGQDGVIVCSDDEDDDVEPY